MNNMNGKIIKIDRITLNNSKLFVKPNMDRAATINIKHNMNINSIEFASLFANGLHDC